MKPCVKCLVFNFLRELAAVDGPRQFIENLCMSFREGRQTIASPRVECELYELFRIELVLLPKLGDFWKAFYEH